LRGLNIAPTFYVVATRKLWFMKPWIFKKANPKFMSYTVVANPICGEDTNGEVIWKIVVATPLPAI